MYIIHIYYILGGMTLLSNYKLLNNHLVDACILYPIHQLVTLRLILKMKQLMC